MPQGKGRTVLVVLHEEILGGATLSILRLLPLLERAGWRFAFWVSSPSPLADHLAGSGYVVGGAPRHLSYSVRALRLPPGPVARVRSLRPYFEKFRAFVAASEPALAHVNSLAGLAEATALRAMGTPPVAHIHEMIPSTAKGLAARTAIRTVATEVIAVSRASGDALALGGWRPRVVYEAAPLPERIAEPSNLDPLRVGSVGVLSRRKGTDTFVDAAALVRAERPEIEFELVGAASDPLDATWAEDVLARARRCGVRHRLSADVPGLLETLDIFALPSRRDPFPIAMLEAMAAGLAVVGALSDGIPEQLDEGAAGLLVDPDDPVALAAAILELADDLEMRRALGAAARRRVKERFTIQSQAVGIAEAWAAALGDG